MPLKIISLFQEEVEEMVKIYILWKTHFITYIGITGEIIHMLGCLF